MSSIAHVVFVGVVQPFKSRKQNKMELLNEVLTMTIMYHIFCFTDFVPDEQIRFYIGYSCLGTNMIHLGLNIYNILSD